MQDSRVSATPGWLHRLGRGKTAVVCLPRLSPEPVHRSWLLRRSRRLSSPSLAAKNSSQGEQHKASNSRRATQGEHHEHSKKYKATKRGASPAPLPPLPFPQPHTTQKTPKKTQTRHDKEINNGTNVRSLHDVPTLVPLPPPHPLPPCPRSHARVIEPLMGGVMKKPTQPTLRRPPPPVAAVDAPLTWILPCRPRLARRRRGSCARSAAAPPVGGPLRARHRPLVDRGGSGAR